MHIRNVLVGAGVVVALMPLVAAAAVFRSGDRPVILAEERITGNAYIAGGSVTSQGAVTGDLIAAGGTVLVTSAISQDLFAAGGNVIISGAIGGDARFAGGNISVQSTIRGDVVAAGGQIELGGSGIGGDVLWAGGTLGIQAPVQGNIELVGGDVMINAAVNGNVHFRGEKLTLGSKAVINGNLTYESPNKAVMETGAVVRGKTTYEPTKNADAGKALAAFVSIGLLLGLLISIAGALVVGLVFKRFANTVVGAITSAPLQELGRGFAAMVLLPVASILLCITIVGLPLGIMGFFLFGAFVVLASIVAAIVLGSLIYKWVTGAVVYEVTWLTILIGAVVCFVLGFIPLFGWIVKAALMFMAAGGIAKIHWGIAKEWR